MRPYGARKGWPTTSTVSTCKAALVHLAHILSAELVDRLYSREYLSPGPTDTAMFGRFPAKSRARRLRASSERTIQASDGRSVGNREAGSLPRLGRFCYVVGADFLIDGAVRPFRAWAPESRCREWRRVVESRETSTSRIEIKMKTK